MIIKVFRSTMSYNWITLLTCIKPIIITKNTLLKMNTSWNERENLSDLKSLYIGPAWLIIEVSSKIDSSSFGKNIKYLSSLNGQTITTK